MGWLQLWFYMNLSFYLLQKWDTQAVPFIIEKIMIKDQNSDSITYLFSVRQIWLTWNECLQFWFYLLKKLDTCTSQAVLFIIEKQIKEWNFIEFWFKVTYLCSVRHMISTMCERAYGCQKLQFVLGPLWFDSNSPKLSKIGPKGASSPQWRLKKECTRILKNNNTVITESPDFLVQVQKQTICLAYRNKKKKNE